MNEALTAQTERSQSEQEFEVASKEREEATTSTRTLTRSRRSRRYDVGRDDVGRDVTASFVETALAVTTALAVFHDKCEKQIERSGRGRSSDGAAGAAGQ